MKRRAFQTARRIVSLLDWVALATVVVGIFVIFAGSFYYGAMRPVMPDDTRAARRVAYIAMGIGSAIAIGVPVIVYGVQLYLKRRFKR